MPVWRSWVPKPGSIYWNSALLVANNGVLALSGFVFWVVAAHFAPPSSIGVATALVGAVLLVSLFGRGGLDIALLKLLPNAEGSAANKIASTTFLASALAGIVLGFLVALASVAFAAFPRFGVGSVGDAFWFALLVGAWSASVILESFFIARHRSEFVLAKNTLFSLARVGSLLVIGTRLGVMGLAWSAVGACLVGVAISLAWWLPRMDRALVPSIAFDPSVLRSGFGDVAANYVVSLTFALPLSLGSIIALQKWGAADAAYFYVLWMFLSLAMALPIALGQTMLVRWSGAHQGRHAVDWIAFLGTAAFSGAVLLGAQIFLPVFGPFYASRGVWPLLPFLLATLPGFIMHTRLASLRASGAHHGVVTVPLIAVVPFLGAMLLLPISVEGSGWAYLASTMAAALAALMFNMRHESWTGEATA